MSELRIGKVGKPQVTADHYFDANYDSKDRFASYWHQINEVIQCEAQPVLEIGIGNGFLANYLRERGADLTTMDIDEDLDPDVVGSITDIPFEEGSFETIACFEVLEHIPYADFLQALREMRRVANQYVIFSIPDRGHMYWLQMKVPFLGRINWTWSFQRFRSLDEPLIKGEHFWEVGVQDYTLERLTDDIEDVGYKIQKTYRVTEKVSHRFFVLEV